MTTLSTIAQASLESGIAKEVLRKWEVRYGFPIPIRDANGNRVYTDQQISRLKVVKKLLDAGFRPAKVVPLEESALLALTARRPQLKVDVTEASQNDNVVEWLKLRNPAFLREKLTQELKKRGLASFLLNSMPTMNVLVGNAWENDEIAVRDEHVYSEMVQVLLREELAGLANPDGAPRILMTTPSGEAHVLGLLMLEAMMCLDGAYCISLGAQSPIDEIISAANDFRADIVALSFSSVFPRKKITPIIKSIRAGLPSHVKVWAGGSGIEHIEQTPRGINFLHSLADACSLVRNYRK